MTTIHAQIPDALLRQAQTIAEREQISIDQLIALALASQISAWEAGKSFSARAASGDWQKAKAVLANAPDVEPEDYDKF
jgi:hypothetical protein